jgi:hypothetical protein
VRHPYAFTTTGGVVVTTQGVFLPDFGCPDGTLLTCRVDADDVSEAEERTPYFRSALNPHSEEPYCRDLYIDMLNDWGWFGDPLSPPSWYTPPRWAGGGAG